MKILLVDDHPLFLAGIRHVLAGLADQVTILEAGSAETAFECLDAHPDLDWICLDLQLPGLDGFDFLAELKTRRITTPIVILSANDSPSVVHRALRAGASGYLSKSTPMYEIRAAFDALEHRGHYVSSSLRAELDNFRAGIADPRSGGIALTRRQRQVLKLVAEGRSNNAIADQLGVAESTVKGHVSTLFSIFDVDNRTGCVREASRLGFVD